VTAFGPQVAVSWFTLGEGDEPRVKLAISDDAGQTYRDPLVIDGADPVGRPDVTSLSDGTLLTVWIGRSEGRTVLKGAHILPEGPTVDPIVLAAVREGRGVGFPRLAALGDGALVAWTDEDLGAVRLIRLSTR
jgi:hypothetical protein